MASRLVGPSALGNWTVNLLYTQSIWTDYRCQDSPIIHNPQCLTCPVDRGNLDPNDRLCDLVQREKTHPGRFPVDVHRRHSSLSTSQQWMGGRAVEGTGLEMRLRPPCPVRFRAVFRSFSGFLRIGRNCSYGLIRPYPCLSGASSGAKRSFAASRGLAFAVFRAILTPSETIARRRALRRRGKFSTRAGLRDRMAFKLDKPLGKLAALPSRRNPRTDRYG